MCARRRPSLFRTIPPQHQALCECLSGGATIGYSGDAGWCEALLEVADGADLFVCSVWSFDTSDPTFLDLMTLLRNRDRLRCGRLILTHLGPSMLERLNEVPIDVATDGLTIAL